MSMKSFRDIFTVLAISTNLFNYQLISNTVCLLEKEGSSIASELTLGHDCNSISKNISFIHEMGGQHYTAIFSVGSDYIPREPTRKGVHTTCRFIKKNHFAIPTECYGKTEFSLHTTTKIGRECISLFE